MTRPKRGRPNTGVNQGKCKRGGSFLAVRTSAEMKEAVAAEADRTGRSMSAVCEIWLEFGRHWINRQSPPEVPE